jgi:hypothetical protein
VQITHIYEGYAACMAERRGAYKIWVGRPEGKRPLERPRLRWEDNIKMDIQEKLNYIDLVYLFGFHSIPPHVSAVHIRAFLHNKRQGVGKRSLFTNGGLCPFHSSCVPVSY